MSIRLYLPKQRSIEILKNLIHILTGSNLGDRARYLAQASKLLTLYLGEVQQASKVYETSAWGTSDEQSPYLNQALSFRSHRSPGQLVNTCLAVEKILGRVRSTPNAARTIDVDLLLMGSIVDGSANCTVPHPRLHLRRFVLEPLSEICPAQIHPIFGKSISQLLHELEDELEVMPLAN